MYYAIVSLFFSLGEYIEQLLAEMNRIALADENDTVESVCNYEYRESCVICFESLLDGRRNTIVYINTELYV